MRTTHPSGERRAGGDYSGDWGYPVPLTVRGRLPYGIEQSSSASRFITGTGRWRKALSRVAKLDRSSHSPLPFFNRPIPTLPALRIVLGVTILLTNRMILSC